MSNTHMALNEFQTMHLKLGPKDLILDVRNPDEFKEVRISQAVNIPLPELMNNLDQLNSFDQIYILCKRGGRAKMAFEMLKNAGYTNLICIGDAGMDAWMEAGYPTARG